jgi:hypothetical protein
MSSRKATVFVKRVNVPGIGPASALLNSCLLCQSAKNAFSKTKQTGTSNKHT